MENILIWSLAYFLGSIPFGVLFSRAKNIDIRAHGSGNIGATNVARTLGKTVGVLTLFCDAAKGGIPVVIASRVLDSPFEIAVAGLMAFLGHLYSVFLQFKGGKGVATGLGVFILLMPLATVSAMGVFAVTLWITRRVALGSIVACLCLPLFGIFYKMPLPFISISTVAALLVLHKHQGNIERILAGTEPGFIKK